MTLAILQPYFCPYLGYFQLINKVDKLVIYDNIEYTRRGWYTKNRFLLNNQPHPFSIPLKRDSDYLFVKERCLADSSHKSVIKTLRQIENSYRRTPFFSEIFPVIHSVFVNPNKNLFDYILHSVVTFTKVLGINTEILKSSDLKIDHSLKSQNKVIAICKHLRADTYINPIGGKDLYNEDIFAENGLDLKFLRMNKLNYDQFREPFVPSLSIIDVLMYNGVEKTRALLTEYRLVQANQT